MTLSLTTTPIVNGGSVTIQATVGIDNTTNPATYYPTALLLQGESLVGPGNSLLVADAAVLAAIVASETVALPAGTNNIGTVVATGTFWQATQPTSTTPGTRTLVPLDVSTVTTGGSPVTALTAGHRTAGGWIMNPLTATANLGINEINTASGTTSSGNTTFIAPGQSYALQPSGNAVSVISADSSHQYSGMGLQ
jgi:hypothetical protein